MAESIHDARCALEFDVWAYVFMPEHIHLLIFPRRQVYDIATIRKRIKAPVALQAIEYFTETSPRLLPKLTRMRGTRVEHLFWQSGGGYDRNIDNPKTLLHSIEYLHQNPVRRGLVKNPGDWKWSSAGWFQNDAESVLTPDPIPKDWVA